MANKNQVILVKLAQRRLGLTDLQYHTVLRNVAAVDSSTQLDNNGFEEVMAFFEEQGFRMKDRPADYFRNKVKLRGTFAGERIVFKIRELAAGTKYQGGIGGLCRTFSKLRTDQPTKLTPKEAHDLVEMLKDVHRRERARQTTQAEPSPIAPASPLPRSWFEAHGGAGVEPEPF